MLPEQGDGRGGGEGEAERPIAAFKIEILVKCIFNSRKLYKSILIELFTNAKITFISVIECKAARGPGPGLGDPPDLD